MKEGEGEEGEMREGGGREEEGEMREGKGRDGEEGE